MATIPIALTTEVDLFTVENPPNTEWTDYPLGLLTMKLGTTIAALGAGDINVVTLTGILPFGYIYRMVELRVVIAGPSEADLDEPESIMLCQFTENGVVKKQFGIFNQVPNATAAGSVVAFQGVNPAITNDFFMIFSPHDYDLSNLRGDPINASKGVSSLGITWVNANPTTDALSWTSYARFLVYTIEQLNRGALWCYNQQT